MNLRFFSLKRRLFGRKNHLPKIVVDGPNVSKDQNNVGDIPEAGRFCVLIEQLCRENKIEHIEIFISAKLKHEIDDMEIVRKLQKEGTIIVTPAARDDDYFALKHAFETDSWILSNDRYLDYQKIQPKLKNWLKSKRITYVWHKKDQRFTFGKNIETVHMVNNEEVI